MATIFSMTDTISVDPGRKSTGEFYFGMASKAISSVPDYAAVIPDSHQSLALSIVKFLFPTRHAGLWASVSLLALRISMAVMLLWMAFALPSYAAWCIIGALALLAGAFTRETAAALAIAVGISLAAASSIDASMTMLGVFAGFLAVAGPGKISADAFLRRSLTRRCYRAIRRREMLYPFS